MSIEIDWAALTTGPSGLALADSIRDFIHDKFQQVTLPRFIRSIHVHSFDFGEECPLVELKDISDPLPEFYDNDNDADEGSSSSSSSSSTSPSAVNRPPSAASIPPNHTLQSSHNPPMKPPETLDPRLATLNLPLPLRPNLPFPPPDQITTPFLSRSNTPGIPIPGLTSNFSYFHLPLSAGLSGTQTPLPRPEQPSRHEAEAAQSPFANPTNTPQPPHHHAPSSPPPTTDRSLDLQTTLHISYTGTLSLSLTAEILLDYPMPSFVGIPLKLQITGLSFDGVALLAYLRRNGADLTRQRRDLVHFCFLGREDARAMVGEEDGGALGGLLREIRVESEIGRQEGGKQVLKNVGKVEKFVLEQVRRIFEEEFVWPSFWTFLV